jgi:hypothetical protein
MIDVGSVGWGRWSLSKGASNILMNACRDMSDIEE